MKRMLLIALGFSLSSLTVTAETGYVYEDANLKLAPYSGIHYNVKELKVSDSDVQAEINSMMEENQQYEHVEDRSVAGFDKINIDYEAYDGTNKLDKYSGTNYLLTVGEDSIIEGFSEQLIGHSVGETVDVVIDYPDDYTESGLSGKNITYKVTINFICGDKIEQVYDDEWVDQNTGVQTTEELEESIREELANSYKTRFDNEVRTQIFSTIMDNSEFLSISDEDIESRKDSYLENYKAYAEILGESYDDFILNQFGISVADFEERIEKTAEDDVEKSIVIKKIADLESITIADDVWDEYLDECADSYGYENTEDLKGDLKEDEELENELRDECLNNLVYDYLLENAVNDAA